jgi:peroxiredoxin
MKKLIILGVIILITISLIVLIENNKPKNIKFEENIGLDIGNIAPDFELNDINGNSVKLSDFLGKPVLINFFATWCGPCRHEMPEFQNIYDQNEIIILGINLQEPIESVILFKDELDLTFPLLIDPKSEIKTMYQVITQPVTYFIDSTGTIVDKKLGPLTINEINKKIQTLEISKI